MINSKRLAEALGITVQAVNLARAEGRVTPIKKLGKEFMYNLEKAVEEYHSKTRQPKSSSGSFHGPSDPDDPDHGGERKSVLDKEPKMWSTQEAYNAKAIFDAQLKQLELDKESKKYLPTKEVEAEVLRIVTQFSRALVGLPTKLKQKIDKLDARDLELIKELCTDIVSECESEL